MSRHERLRAVHMSVLACVAGLLAGLVAYALFNLIALALNVTFMQAVSFELPSVADHNLGAWIVIVPAIGGLLVGLMARYGSPKIKGHGIPEAMEAVLTSDSRISLRVAIFKPISTVVAIGSGGPFGAEGPIIQTGGALGSLLGQVVSTTAAERKVLLACGAAGGMAAIFGTPLAGVILAIELLLFEFRPRSFIPLVIATAVATALRHALIGDGPLFAMDAVDFGLPFNAPAYVLFAILIGFVAVGFSKLLFVVEDAFEALPIGDIWRPALGGLGLGMIGLFAPEVLGVGYDLITGVLNNEFAVAALLSIAVFKTAALLVSLGSGTSGGLLAPMFMTGAALGALFAIVGNALLPGAPLEPAAFALVGMAALFAAASRATFALIVFAFEITRNYDAILPLMLVCVIATGISILYMRTTIMTEKLARRGLRVNQEFEVDPLERADIASVMQTHFEPIDASAPLASVATRLGLQTEAQSHSDALVVVDADNNLVGILTRSDVLRAQSETVADPLTAHTICTTDVVRAYPDETVREAVRRMLYHDIGRLPVVSRADDRKLVGYIDRAAVIAAHRRGMHEDGFVLPGS
ncbi:chloride channel protein [Salinisphaera orenii]|uniref:Chloride channel protein n=1 Tax=Salinisphaera orenii YIM 95161 TaxID=1051139 RepID=A0A423PIT0_9GAMM|nr:chloride channel protein [Salinisphaera halophila]ROO25486.1 chloride channel protein [Salinisphaera halophila YIM 95161]